MTHYLITFRSLTHAQRAARVLERAGITTAVIKRLCPDAAPEPGDRAELAEAKGPVHR